jgi:hypothetical protein
MTRDLPVTPFDSGAGAGAFTHRDTAAFRTRMAGDTYDRLQILADGSMRKGDGATSPTRGRSVDFTTLPALQDICITQPPIASGWLNDFYTPSIVSGRLRVTATMPNGDANMRRALLFPELGERGDFDAKFSLGEVSSGVATAFQTARFQWGLCCGRRRRADVLQGAASAGGAATLTTSGLTAHQYAANATDGREYWIELIAGTGFGQKRRILDNSTTVITTSANWTTNPDATSKFRVYAVYFHGWGVWNTVIGGSHDLFQLTHCEGTVYDSNPSGTGNVQGSGFYTGATRLLQPLNHWATLPWHVKVRRRGNVVQCGVWTEDTTVAGGGTNNLAVSEPAFDDTSNIASWVLPSEFCETGMLGIQVGHLANGEYLGYDRFEVA